MNPLNVQPGVNGHPAGSHHHTKKGRRQYAANQYDIISDLAPEPAEAAYRSPAYPIPDGANAMQTATGPYGLPPSTAEYPYGDPSPYQGANMASVQKGFQSMNLAGYNSGLNQLQSVDLINQNPEISSVDGPPPPLILPEKAAIRPSEHSNASPAYAQCTLNAVPANNSLLKKSNLPFALIVRPFTALHNEDEDIPIVSDQVISRCSRCKAYINPYSIFLEGGHRWRCVLCNLINEVPQGFDWDRQTNMQRDRWSRSELNCAVVDFDASQEYMSRPPQPLILVFAIDVSRNAVQSGLVATVARSILESLDRIPNSNGRTKVSIIAFDSSLYFFPISPESEETKMLVVSDLEEPYLPKQCDLVYDLKQCRKGIENLLEHLIEMFQDSRDTGNAMGSALLSSHKMIHGIGGKIIVFSASLPTKGKGALLVRDDQKAWGTSKESGLLQTQNSFYKSFAVDCSKYQISVDMFLCSSTYQDVASLSCLPRYTGGQTHYYPGWSALCQEDAMKLAAEISDHLSMEIALEAVMRVRGTTNLRMSSFYGNFFNRSSDLCALPSLPRDQGYAVEIAIDDNITKPFIVLQTAILHTTCHGERRIRVITLAIPTTEKLGDVYASADQNAIATFFAFKAVERVLSSSLDSGRTFIMERLLAILETYRKHLTGQNTGASLPLRLSSNLRLLPMLCLALSKHTAFRKTQIPSDLRSAALNTLATSPAAILIPQILPRLYCLHDMPDEAGLPGENGIVLPPRMNLTYGEIAQFGLYLIDNGEDQTLWIGRDAVPLLLQDVFGVTSLSELPTGKITLPYLKDSSLNQRILNILAKLRSIDKGTIRSPTLWLTRADADPMLQKRFASLLVEDKLDSHPSYFQFLNQLKEKANA